MKDIDRLKKAERKLSEHQDVCKRCEERLTDPTIMECSIVHQLHYNIGIIKEQINNKIPENKKRGYGEDEFQR